MKTPFAVFALLFICSVIFAGSVLSQSDTGSQIVQDSQQVAGGSSDPQDTTNNSGQSNKNDKNDDSAVIVARLQFWGMIFTALITVIGGIGKATTSKGSDTQVKNSFPAWNWTFAIGLFGFLSFLVFLLLSTFPTAIKPALSAPGKDTVQTWVTQEVKSRLNRQDSTLKSIEQALARLHGRMQADSASFSALQRLVESSTDRMPTEAFLLGAYAEIQKDIARFEDSVSAYKAEIKRVEEDAFLTTGEAFQYGISILSLLVFVASFLWFLSRFRDSKFRAGKKFLSNE